MAVIQKTPEATTATPSAVRTTPSISTQRVNTATADRTIIASVAGPSAAPTTSRPEDRGVDKLRLTYTVLLGAAACLAHIGVVTQNQTSDAGAPDAPPPAVLEQRG